MCLYFAAHQNVVLKQQWELLLMLGLKQILELGQDLLVLVLVLMPVPAPVQVPVPVPVQVPLQEYPVNHKILMLY